MEQNSDELIPTRWSLVARLRDPDDQESWREFFDTYSQLIRGVAIKSGLAEAEAEDVVQETIISISKSMPDFKAEPQAGSFKAFLFTIIRRRIADQFRKRSPGQESGLRHADETRCTSTIEKIADPAGLELDAVWNQEWEQNLLAAAMERVKRQINLKQYQIYDLYVGKQCPVRKVAATLGVNIGAVSLAKHRVAGLLKQELKRLEDRMI